MSGAGERLIWCISIGYAVLAAIRWPVTTSKRKAAAATARRKPVPTSKVCVSGAAGAICAWIIGYVHTRQDVEVVNLIDGWMRRILMFFRASAAFLMVSRAPFPHWATPYWPVIKASALSSCYLAQSFSPRVVLCRSGHLDQRLSVIGPEQERHKFISNVRHGRSLLEEAD